MATILDRLVTELRFNTDRAGLRQAETGVRKFRKQIDGLANRLSIAGAVGTAAFGIIGKAGLDTESALLRTRAELGLTEDQMRTLREEALRVGSSLPLNTSDIVNAQRAYGKLGATYEEIIRDTPAIAGAAVASGLPVEQVAQYARVIQNVFGGDIQENLDLMLRTANRSPASFQSLAESVQFAGQSAVDAGLDFKTYLSTLAGTAGAGRGVETVAQGLVALFGRLAKSSEGIGRGGKIVTDAFTGVGISMDDVDDAMDGTTEGFVKLLRLINDAGLSSQQLTALLSTLAGDTYAASISYAVQNPEVIENLLAEAGAAPGEVQRQMDIILEGASGGLTETRALIDTILNRLSEFGVLSGIETMTRHFNQFATALTRTDDEGNLVHEGWLRLISILITGLASLLAVGIGLKVVSFALGGYLGLTGAATFLTGLWSSSMLGLRIQLGLMAIKAKIAAAATWLLNSALWANPVVLIVAGIIALIAAIGIAVYFIWKYRDAIVEFGKQAWIWIKERVLGAFHAVWAWLKQNWPLILGILLGPFGLAIGAFFRWRHQILDFFRNLIDRILGFFRNLNLFDAGRQFLMTFVDGILSIGDTVKDAVTGVLKKARDLLPFSDAKEGPLSGLTASGRAIVDTLAKGVRGAAPLGSSLRPALAGLPSLAAPLPVGPLPAPTVQGGTTISLSLRVDRVEINAPGGDPDDVYEAGMRSMGDAMRQLAEQVDSQLRA